LRVLGGVFEFVSLFVILNFSYLFFTILAWFAAFHDFYWLCGFFLLLDDLLSFSLASSLLAMLHGVMYSNFKLCAFVVNGLIKQKIKKSSDQFLDLIVMSH
jgi:hypothetical protein